MQDHRAMSKALARLAAVSGSRPKRAAVGKEEVERLVRHAKKYGPDGVLYTGYQVGLNDTELIALAEALDDIRVKAEGKRAKAMSGPQLARLVERIPAYLR